MFCHNCGKQIEANSKFCASCGALQKESSEIQSNKGVQSDPFSPYEYKDDSQDIISLPLMITGAIAMPLTVTLLLIHVGVSRYNGFDFIQGLWEILTHGFKTSLRIGAFFDLVSRFGIYICCLVAFFSFLKRSLATKSCFAIALFGVVGLICGIANERRVVPEICAIVIGMVVFIMCLQERPAAVESDNPLNL